MNIYSSTETSFTKNGYGFLSDCLTAKVTEILNGENTLYLEYPVNSKLSEYLVEQNIIKTNVGNNDYQLFRIYRVDKDFQKVYVYANHITYDLNLNMLVDVYPKNKNCNDFGAWILNNTQYATSFSFYSDISSSGSARYVRKNPIEAILGSDPNSMINLFGGELKRDNFTLKLLENRGQNNHVKLIIGKNITEIKTNVDITDLYTRIMPIGFDGLILPEKFVDSPLINSYPTPRIAKIEFSDIKYDPESEEEGVYTDINDAYQALRDAVQVLFDDGIDKPTISIKVDWLELSKTEQYKNQYAAFEKVGIADTITANILGIDYTTKVVKTVYNVLTDTIDSFEIGTLQKNIVNSINFTQREIEQINPGSILEDARASATNLLNTALTGYIYLDYENGDLYIMDNPDPIQAVKVWRWNLNGLGYSSTGINGTYGTAITMNGSIVADYITTGHLNTNVIEGYGALSLQVTKNKNDIATIKAEISDIADITTSSTSENLYIDSTELQNIAVSNPIRVEIYPLITNIQALYPRNDLYPSNTLYPRSRILKFTNTYNNDVFTYELPMDLLYYNSEIYDTFVADYETNLVTINKKCGLDNNGNVIVLDNPVNYTYSYSDTFAPYFELTEGNYQVELEGYSTGFLMVRLMVLNAYTAQYATKIEMNSAINQTAEEINIEVNRKVDNDEIISAINLSTEEIKIESDKININGTISANGNFKVNTDGTMEAYGCKLGGYITFDEGQITNTSGSLIDKNYYRTQMFPDLLGIDGAGKLDNGSIIYQGMTRLYPGSFNFTYYKYDNWETDTIPSEVYMVDFFRDTLTIQGNLEVTGTKNRLVEIDDGSKVKLNAYETTTPYFADIGSDKTNSKGECKIYIDKTFGQTIEKDTYKVFIQELGEGKLWVEKHNDYFIVKGVPNLEFDYEIKAIQKGYKDIRLEKVIPKESEEK